MNDLSFFEEKTVTTKELAEQLGVSVDTVQNAVKKAFPKRFGKVYFNRWQADYGIL